MARLCNRSELKSLSFDLMALLVQSWGTPCLSWLHCMQANYFLITHPSINCALPGSSMYMMCLIEISH